MAVSATLLYLNYYYCLSYRVLSVSYMNLLFNTVELTSEVKEEEKLIRASTGVIMMW